MRISAHRAPGTPCDGVGHCHQPAASHTGTATILFADLVGSTAQRAQLGEEAAEAVRRAHDRLLADAVAAHRGTIAKSVGDGIMATFAGAAEGVGAAVAIQQPVDGHNRRTTAALAVRIGISLAPSTVTDCYISRIAHLAAHIRPARSLRKV